MGPWPQAVGRDSAESRTAGPEPEAVPSRSANSPWPTRAGQGRGQGGASSADSGQVQSLRALQSPGMSREHFNATPCWGRYNPETGRCANSRLQHCAVERRVPLACTHARGCPPRKQGLAAGGAGGTLAEHRLLGAARVPGGHPVERRGPAPEQVPGKPQRPAAGAFPVSFTAAPRVASQEVPRACQPAAWPLPRHPNQRPAALAACQLAGALESLSADQPAAQSHPLRGDGLPGGRLPPAPLGSQPASARAGECPFQFSPPRDLLVNNYSTLSRQSAVIC